MTTRTKYLVELAVVVPAAKLEFKEGLGVGVLVRQNLTYELTDVEVNDPMFQMELLDQQKRILEDHIKVLTTIRKVDE